MAAKSKGGQPEDDKREWTAAGSISSPYSQPRAASTESDKNFEIEAYGCQ